MKTNYNLFSLYEKKKKEEKLISLSHYYFVVYFWKKLTKLKKYFNIIQMCGRSGDYEEKQKNFQVEKNKFFFS